MLGGADNPNGELLSYIIGADKVYLQRTAVAGIPRYGLDGLPAGQVSECDALNARRWLAVREQQKLKMKTMQEQSASTEKTER